MAGTKPEQEPSIEEILASIRQIISDDDEPRPAATTLDAAKATDFDIPLHTPDAPQDEPSRASFADVLDLTNEIVDEPKTIDYSEAAAPPIPLADPIITPEPDARAAAYDASVTAPTARSSDLDLSSGAEDNSRPSFGRDDADFSANGDSMTNMNSDDVDALFSAPAADATTQAFAKLLGNIPVEREDNKRLYADGRITLEDIAKDLLRPMLRQWVDEHVPRLVERLVEKEIEKLVRQARD